MIAELPFFWLLSASVRIVAAQAQIRPGPTIDWSLLRHSTPGAWNATVTTRGGLPPSNTTVVHSPTSWQSTGSFVSHNIPSQSQATGAEHASASTANDESIHLNTSMPITTTSATASVFSTPTVPFGVFVTTVSGTPYTLTYVSRVADVSTAHTSSGDIFTVPTVGAIWVIVNPSQSLPKGISGPPSGAPEPTQASGSLCVFGCGDSNDHDSDIGGGGGGSDGGVAALPCVINCGGGSNGNDGGSQSRHPTATNTRRASDSSTTSECSVTAAQSCDETVFITTSFNSGSSSTIKSSTSTRCATITACDAQSVTATTTSATSTSEEEFVCGPTACAGSCGINRKRADLGPKPTDVFKRGTILALDNYGNATGLEARDLPAPASGQTIDNFIWNIFDSGHVRGAGQGPPLVEFGPESIPTSRYDAFEDEAFSVGVTGLFGCISIVVVSRQGVWTSHWWETTFRDAFGPNPATTTNFYNTIIRWITNPVETTPGGRDDKYMPLPEVPVGVFAEENHPQILLIAVGASGHGRQAPPAHPRVVDAMMTEVRTILPGVKPGAVVTWTYPRLPGGFTAFEGGALNGNARGKVLLNYDPSAAEGAKGFQLWMETEVVLQDIWGPNCADEGSSNNKRQVGACSSKTPPSSASIPSGTTLTTSLITGSDSLNTATMTGISTASNSSDAPRTNPPPSTSLRCYAYQNPRGGTGKQGCQCSGRDGLLPFLTNTASTTSFNVCGYTTLPPSTITQPPTATPFTSTDSDQGLVYSCAGSSILRVAGFQIPQCTGSSAVISTITSIYTAYTASSASASASLASASASSASASSASASSASAASASAASSSAAAATATPTAACLIWDSMLYYTIQVYGIRSFSLPSGDALLKQEKGCGALEGWTWETGCDGDTAQASFTLPFLIKAGCVERAIKSAGGPGLRCEGAGVAVPGEEDKVVCKAPSQGLKVGAMIEQGLGVERKVRVSDVKEGNGGGVEGVATPTTTHVLARPGNTAAPEA
ncbi:hypothetical protein BDZ85DRAFT_246149 [Elsinoe ampelina]|uniref:Uncharacterized protein n=1 Tax=Elsinoe ampelina TaxID=302913 RepID=A0A6A6GQ55_9PEZI|nr:hypothetical protein BDZ85DRAFT_246149 [Elsinoe ampelina]